MRTAVERPASGKLGALTARLGRSPAQLLQRRLRRLVRVVAARSDEPPASLAALPPKPPCHLRLVTLNAAHGRRDAPHQAFCRRQTTQRNLESIGEAIRHLAPDVVALQEADGPSAWSGNFDHVATLAELAVLRAHYRGDHNPFGFGRFPLASGTALLARYPLLQPISRRFGAHGADTKGFVLATVEVEEWGGRELDLVSVHLDPTVAALRRRQIGTLIDTLRERRRDLVVLGDLNCCWDRDPGSMDLLTGALDLKAYRGDRAIPTFPSARPRHRLDWILISRGLAFRGYATVAARLSDHLGVVADLALAG